MHDDLENEPMRVTLRTRAARSVGSVVDWIFGYDFFVAYTRRDADDYALALVRELRARKFNCFLDKSDFGAGESLSAATDRALRKSSALILIGSPRVFESTYVPLELGLAATLGRKIVPIDVDRALSNPPEADSLTPVLGDRIRIDEKLTALNSGPSDDVIGHVLETFDLTTQQTKRARLLGAGAFVFAVAAISALVFALQANAARSEAEASLRRATARLLTIQARAELADSPTRALLLGATAVDAAPLSDSPDPSTEEFLRTALSQIRGRPLGRSLIAQRAKLYAISPDGVWALTTGPASHPVLLRFDTQGKIVQQITLESIEAPEEAAFSPDSRILCVGAQRISPTDPVPTKAATTDDTNQSDDSNDSSEKNDSDDDDGAADDERILRPGAIAFIPVESADRPSTYQRTALEDNSQSVRRFAFSKSGRFIRVDLSSSRLDGARLFRIDDDGVTPHEVELAGTPIRTPEMRDAVLSEPWWDFSPDERWLVSYQRDNASLLWRIDTSGRPQPYSLTNGSTNADRSAAFSADGKWLVTYRDSANARLWDMRVSDPSGSRRDLTIDHNGAEPVVAFSPDSHWIVAGRLLWPLTTDGPARTPIRLMNAAEFAYRWQLAFTENGRALLLIPGSEYDAVSVWTLTTNARGVSRVRIGGRHAVSDNRRWLLQFDRGGGIATLWDLARIGETASRSDLPGAAVTHAQFALDHRWLATSHMDGSIQLQRLNETGIRSAAIRKDGPAINDFQFSPHGGWLIASSRQSPLSSYSPDLTQLVRLDETGSATAVLLSDEDGGADKTQIATECPAGKLEFSSDDRWLIARSPSDTTACVWNLRASHIAGSRLLLKGHDGPMSGFDFVAGGNALITTESLDLGDRFYNIQPRLWDLSGETDGVYPVTVSKKGARAVWARFSPTGAHAVAVDDDERLHVYSVTGDRFRMSLTLDNLVDKNVESRNPTSVPPRFDSTGRWLLVTAKDGNAYIIDCTKAAAGTDAVTLLGDGPVLAMDGEKSVVVVGSVQSPYALRVWDLGGTAPTEGAQLPLEWARRNSNAALRVTVISRDAIAAAGPRSDSSGSEMWRYDLRTREHRRIGRMSTQSEASGEDVIAAEGVFSQRAQTFVHLEGVVPHPRTYREVHDQTETEFTYLVTPDGRWAVGRRKIVEGYPEFGRKTRYLWHAVFDLWSRTPQRPVLQLPRVQESVFAEFSGDSGRWVAVSESGTVTVITLPTAGVPRSTTIDIDRYFAGRFVSAMVLPIGIADYPAALSAKGDWLVTRRESLLYLVPLKAPFEGKVLRGLQARDSEDLEPSFSANDDIVFTGTRFWRTRLTADLLWPVDLGEAILSTSADAKWLLTSSAAGISLHPVDLSRVVEKARQMAGREFTDVEMEQFLGRPRQLENATDADSNPDADTDADVDTAIQ